MKKIQLDILALKYSQAQTGAYSLILGEADGHRKLSIIIGGFEAQAIAIAIEKMNTSRPLTHDLFKLMADAYHIHVKEVVIYNLVDGIFFARLVCDDGIKQEEIDARTSDAIALAIRFGCPIYTHDFILNAAGTTLPETQDSDLEDISEDDVKHTASSTPLSELSKNELKDRLQQAIDNEDYEEATRIRDEINKRKE
ncbi:MAG: bifunctional nuclease family protein [Candidatus Competibacteraceae bacterium]|nr:bifunctional nuclease family protein [Candidatus Competibacteraceae bacterium]